MFEKLFKSHRPQISSGTMLEALRREAIAAQAHHHYRHAISLWVEVASHTLGDPVPSHRIGELYVRLGQTHHAVRHLATAAQDYALCNQQAKAHAMRRLVEELLPGFDWDDVPLAPILPNEAACTGPEPLAHR